MGEYEHAIADYTEIIRINPGGIWGYSVRGDAYREMGDYERAIADYTEVIRLSPGYANAYRDRGLVHKDQGDLTAARADWERAIELYEAQGQTDEAEEVRGWLAELGE
jgi:tetratricopeptide (TPR) repeat protein